MRLKPHRLTLLSAFALGGLLASTAGCPAKLACPPCYVDGVMASGGKPNPAPKSSVSLQLDSGFSSEKVSKVNVTLTDANGVVETLSYSGDKVAKINATSLTSIDDPGLYDVNGKPPVTAEVDISFSSGKSTGPMSIDVRAETTTATGTTPTGPAATQAPAATGPVATDPAAAPVK